MARNGSGVFTPPAADYPAVASTLIESTKFNNVIDDIATALTGSIAADGQTTITANIPMNSKKLTGLAAGATAGDSVRYEQLAGSASQDFAAGNLTVAGAVNEARGSVAMHATTMNLWAQPNIIDGTGSAATITAIANAPQAGARRVLYPIAATTITNGATFAVDGEANYTTAAGDALEFEAITTSTYKVHVTKKDGTAVVDTTPFASSAENIAGTVENKAVDPLGIREALNCTGIAPVYACRAWVNFNGTGTAGMRANGNVSSITDNGVGDYTVNFTTAMPDANYSVTAMTTKSSVAARGAMICTFNVDQDGTGDAPATGSCRVRIWGASTAAVDAAAVDAWMVCLAFFR